MALKSLEELNWEFLFSEVFTDRPEESNTTPHSAAEPQDIAAPEIFNTQPRQTRLKKKRGLFTTISDVLFSLAIIMILAVVLMSGSNGGTPITILGYSYFSVQSPSMQDEIPKGSFILVKHVDPQSLKVGDNITFMVDRTTSWTHKINDIYENYDHSRARAFQTRGVNNSGPDEDLVYEANVVGKVILAIPVLGAILMNLGQNVFLIFIIFGLCILFSFLIRGVFIKPGSGVRTQSSEFRRRETH